jgi:hypothetical protein
LYGNAPPPLKKFTVVLQIFQLRGKKELACSV